MTVLLWALLYVVGALVAATLIARWSEMEDEFSVGLLALLWPLCLVALSLGAVVLGIAWCGRSLSQRR